MRWKIINPVLYALMIVLGLVLLMWTLILLNSPAPGKAQSYFEVLKIFFHPLSLPNSKGLGEKMISIASTSLVVTGAIWITAYISSAQPYIRWLRIGGIIFGIFAVLVWVHIVFAVFFLSGLRH
jgi:hypothetical protein